MRKIARSGVENTKVIRCGGYFGQNCKSRKTLSNFFVEQPPAADYAMNGMTLLHN